MLCNTRGSPGQDPLVHLRTDPSRATGGGGRDDRGHVHGSKPHQAEHELDREVQMLGDEFRRQARCLIQVKVLNLRCGLQVGWTPTDGTDM